MKNESFLVRAESFSYCVFKKGIILIMFSVERVTAATVLIDRVIAGLNVVRLMNFTKILLDTGR